MKLPRAIRHWCAYAGIGPTILFNQSGMNHGMLASWEKGIGPTLKSLVRLEQGLSRMIESLQKLHEIVQREIEEKQP